MSIGKVHCPTWVIIEEKFVTCIRQALRPIKETPPDTLEEILGTVMPKLSDRLRIVRPEVIREEVLRQLLDMGLLSEKDVAKAWAQIQFINQYDEFESQYIGRL